MISVQYTGKIEGERAFSTRVLNGVYLDPAMYWLPIERPDGSLVTAADGTFDKAIHVYLPGRGRMNALKRFEYIAKRTGDQFQVQYAAEVCGEVG